MKLQTCRVILKPVGVVFLVVFLASVVPVMAQNDPREEEWIQLFNGENLQDWDIKITDHDLNDNYGHTFRVEEGVIKVAYDQYQEFDGKFGHDKAGRP